MGELADYEGRLRRAGLPLLIEDYSASEDVLTRAAPLLALVFVGEMLGAIDLEWAWYANVGAALGGLAILLAAAAGLNVVRGRPAKAMPDRIGKSEIAFFVLVPALLPAIFGGQWRSAIVTSLSNGLIVALVLGVVGYGLLSIVRWAATRLLSQLAYSLVLLARAVPLLMVFSLVLFLTAEMWQVFAGVPDAYLAILTALFVALGTVFLAARLPREVRAIERAAGGGGPPLRRSQRINVGLVMFVGQALQVLVVSVAVGAFFVAFGLLAIDPALVVEWSGHSTEIARLDLLGDRVTLTEELLRVAGGLAAFSGLYYAIAVLTDSTYREEFLEELTDELRKVFEVRAEYLDARRAAAPASSR